MSQSQSQGGGRESKRQKQKRADREFVCKFDAFEEKVRGSAPDVVKADEAGRKAFLELADQLESIQEEQLQQEGCSTSMVRGAAAVCRFAQIGLKRSKQIAQGGNSFTVKDFIKHLQTRFPAQVQDDNGESSGIDWKKNSEVAAQYFAATPAALFLGNPLGKSFEPKPRKEIVRQKRRQNVEEERPVVDGEGEDADNKSSEKRKSQLLKALRREGPPVEQRLQTLKKGEKMSFAKIITDPNSFGDTCENMFACSFLVERNDLAISLDEEGHFLAELVVHGQEGEEAKHEAENLQRDILKMDWEMFDKLVLHCFPNGTANAQPFFKFDPSLPEDKSFHDHQSALQAAQDE